MIVCDSELDELISQYRAINPERPALLFNDMLVRGYRSTTLDSVKPEFLEPLIFAKVNLGMLITLFDDFADNIKFRNPALLNVLYNLPKPIKAGAYNPLESKSINLAQVLSRNIFDFIDERDRNQQYLDLFLFDLQQFYQCNRYCEVISDNPSLASLYEAKQMFPFNMGMVMAGMLDLIASTSIHTTEFSAIRHCLHLGQRYGSLCNTLNTLDREVLESDLTNEALMIALKQQLINSDMLKNKDVNSINHSIKPVVQQLKQNQQQILQDIRQYQTLISFNVEHYIQGLVELKAIHEQLRGSI